MYPVPPHFRPRAESDVVELVEKAPLAWLVAADLSAIRLPVRPIVQGERLIGFRGHMPRRIAGRFVDNPDALLLVTGPSAYVSPSWFTNRRQAPTWSSASAAFPCSICLIDDSGTLHESLVDLVEAMEAGRASAWGLEELGDRYEGLAAHIVAFRADIIDQRAAFRLGQDEDEQTFAEILAGLRSEGNDGFADLMAQFRPSAGARTHRGAGGTDPA